MADINTALAVLEGVAAQMKYLYGSLDVPWGDFVKMKAGKYQLPANGGPGELGSFRVLDLQSLPNGQSQAIFGDSFIAAISFLIPFKLRF